MLFQLALSLEQVHAKDVIHRDLKPSNIFLRSSDERPLLCLGDFGLACSITETPYELENECGTPGYVDPEILARTAIFSTKSDIYSLGCIAFMLLTGQSLAESLIKESLPIDYSVVSNPG